uniref:Uncharacterized protein n=1 Tax=Octopus bimaculoides TaxID=37653 RepID=A0A0L8GQ55_OCTBM
MHSHAYKTKKIANYEHTIYVCVCVCVCVCMYTLMNVKGCKTVNTYTSVYVTYMPPWPHAYLNMQYIWTSRHTHIQTYYAFGYNK